MKNTITIIFILALTLYSCGGSDKKSLAEIIADENLTEIRAKKSAILKDQQLIIDQLKQLDEAIGKLDKVKKIPLITTLTIKDEKFNHYLELQGSVTTKELLILYPEFSGILTQVYVQEGQWVKKDQILAKIDDGGLNQQLAQLQIQTDLAKTTYERQKRLWDQKIGSEMQYLQSKSNYEAQDKAIKQLQKQLDKTLIKAPFSGTIDDILTEQGSVVVQGQSQLMRIINLSNMYIETNVPEKHITYITKNKNVVVEFPILGISIDSKIRQVSHFINPANRTFKIEIAVPNKDNQIKPNLTVKLKINDYSNDTALLIPQSIISENAKGEQYIYVVKNSNESGEGIAEQTIIETGKSQDDVVEVTNGIEIGNEIIVEGARRVNNGQTVKVINN